MSSLALMRWLEGSPERYDAGMQLLTFGSVSRLHTAIADAAIAKPGDRVLEIGCGTGTVTALLLARGARVTAIDQSPEMLEQARQRVTAAATADATEPDTAVEWLEQTAAEIDALPAQSFDAIVASLCLSDMSVGERAFVLRETRRLLAPGGRLVVGDEVHAKGWRHAAQRLWRIPQATLGWLLVGSLSHPIVDLSAELCAAGFEIRSERHWLMGTLALFVAEPSR